MKRTIFIALTLLLVIGFPLSAEAQQRMGLLPGRSVRISANGNSELAARCLDEHAAPPTTSSRYTQVFNAQSDAVIVKYDGQNIPLQRAIDQGLVSISGVTPGGAFSARINAVRINNLTSKPIEVQVKKAAVLGGSRHQPFDYDVSSLIRGDQRGIWARQVRMEKARNNQTTLNELGYYNGSIDGQFGPGSREAVLSFQRDHGLVADGVIGGNTRTAFTEAQSRQERLQRINGDSQEYLTLSMEYHDRTAAYVLFGSEGKSLYRGNNVPELMNRINTALRDNSSRTVYLDMKNFSPDKIDGFRTNLSLYKQREGSTVDIKTLERPGGRTTSQDQFFNSGRLRVQEVSEPVLVNEGKFNGYYQGFVRVLQGTQRAVIRVYGKSKELVQRFTNSLRQYLSRTGATNESPANVINKVRNELKLRGEIKDGDLQIEFEDELGNIFFVDLEEEIFNPLHLLNYPQSLTRLSPNPRVTEDPLGEPTPLRGD